MFSQHFVKSRFSIWTSPSPLVPVPWHNCKIEVSLYYSPPHRLSLKWIKRHRGGKVAFNEQLMNSQKCNWYTCDSIAFIALLFDGLLVNADKRKNLAISKPERAKKRQKEMANKQPFENYNVHLQKNVPSVLAKCQCPSSWIPNPTRFSSHFSRSAFRAILEIEHSIVPLKQSINPCTSLISDCSSNTTLDAPQFPSENSFSSPYYPDGFPMNMTCGWFITAPENQTVKLQLTSWLSSSSKSSDRVEVYDVDGSELSANSLRLSNPHANTDTIYSKFRSLYILFKSDSHPQGRSLSESGIKVLYTAFETGETITLQLKNVLSQNHFLWVYFLAYGWIQDAWRGLMLSSLCVLSSYTQLLHQIRKLIVLTSYGQMLPMPLLLVFDFPLVYIYIILNAIRFWG